MNIVVVAPRKIVMIKNPFTKTLYNNLGLEVMGEISADELLKGAGGIGCATGILERELV
jgi:arginine deiminase